MRTAIAAIVVGLAFAAGLLVGAVAPPEPSCPTEDSCSIDYRDGAWHIKEDTP